MEQSDVFVSYRRSDVEFTKQLVKALQATGREVWVDWEDIPPGVEGFSDEIQRGIEATDAFIAVLSPSYLQSPYCLMELKEALRLKKRVVPVVLQKFDPEPPPEGIGHINWVYFTPHAGQDNTFEESFPKVIQALETDHDHARQHTRLLTRAIEWEKRQQEKSYLLTGTEIDQAESWQVQASAKIPAPTELQLNYILDSRKQQRIQQRRITISIGVLLVLAVIAAVYAVFQTYQANISAQVNHSNALASAALQPGNENIAVALALEAIRSQHAPESSYRTLAQVAYSPGSIRHMIKTDEQTVEFISPAISPDGELVVVKNKLYDMASGDVILEFENAPKVTLTGLFLPDGKYVILAGDRDVEEHSPDFIYLGMYDVSTGKLLQKFDTGIGIGEVQLSSDGKMLVAYQPDGKVSWWNIQTGKKVREFEVSSYIHTISPDLKWLAEVLTVGETEQEELVITNLKTGQVQQNIPNPFPENGITLIEFSNDSTEIAIVGAELTTYNVETGEKRIRLNVVPNETASLRYSPDGSSLVAASRDQIVTVWERNTGNVIQTFTAHRDTLLFAGYAQNGERVVSMDGSGVIINWDVFPGNMERGPVLDGQEVADTITPDGRFLIYVRYSPSRKVERLIIRDTQTLQEVSAIPIMDIPPETSKRFTNVYHYGYYLTKELESGLFCYTTQPFTITEEGWTEPAGDISIHVASLADGKVIRTWNIDKQGNIQKVRFSPTGKKLYVHYMDESYLNHMEVWNIDDGSLEHSYVMPYSGNLDYELSPDGTRLLLTTVTYNELGETISESIQMIDTSDGTTLFTINEKMPLRMFFTSDGAQFVFVQASEFGMVKSHLTIHDSKTGKALSDYILDIHVYSDFKVRSGGKTLLTIHDGGGAGGGGGTFSGISLFSAITTKEKVAEWDFATGELLWTFPEHTIGGFLSPDDKQMYSEFRGYIVTWRFDTHEELIRWACGNRYVPEFSDQQRERFGIKNKTSICQELDN